MMFIAINYQCERIIPRLQGDASAKIGYMTYTSPKRMVLCYINKKDTIIISFNQQGKKCKTLFVILS